MDIKAREMTTEIKDITKAKAHIKEAKDTDLDQIPNPLETAINVDNLDTLPGYAQTHKDIREAKPLHQD